MFEKYIENNNQKQDLKDYLLNPNINNYKSMIANTKNDDAKNVFAVLAEELNSVFELTAIKKINIHYGSLPKPQANEQEKYIGEYEQSKFIAIPYNNGNPMITSRFANPIEALNYTIQKELFGDNFVNYIAIEIEKLKKNIDNFDYLYKNLVGELLAKKSIFEIYSIYLKR